MLKKIDYVILSMTLFTSGIAAYAITQHEQEKIDVSQLQVQAIGTIATLDIDQLIADRQGQPGTADWIDGAIKKYCPNGCTLLNSNSVIKGNFVDLNQMYRLEVGLKEPVKQATKEELQLINEAFAKRKEVMESIEQQPSPDQHEATVELSDLMNFFQALSEEKTAEAQAEIVDGSVNKGAASNEK